MDLHRGGFILAFGLLPSFRSVRLLNIIALIGTNYSCLYFFIFAAKHGRVPGAITRCCFYSTGTSILLLALYLSKQGGGGRGVDRGVIGGVGGRQGGGGEGSNHTSQQQAASEVG